MLRHEGWPLLLTGQDRVGNVLCIYNNNKIHFKFSMFDFKRQRLTVNRQTLLLVLRASVRRFKLVAAFRWHAPVHMVIAGCRKSIWHALHAAIWG